MSLAEMFVERYGPFMSIEEVADVLKIKKGTVYNQIAEGRIDLPYAKMGKQYLFPSADVGRHIQSIMQRNLNY